MLRSATSTKMGNGEQAPTRPTPRRSLIDPVAGGFLLAVVLLPACDARPEKPGTDRDVGRASGPETPVATRQAPRDDVQTDDAQAGAFFVDRGAATGLDFLHFNGMTGQYYMAEVTGAGAALFDFDNDGDLDAYLVQGRLLEPGKTLEDATFPPPRSELLRDRLFRNDLEVRADDRRSFAFTDITEASQIDARGYGMGVTSGDYDNDGFVDLYITNWGPNELWRNRGDGTFEDVTEAAGVADDRWSVPATFFDYDRDGWLDLFVGNYIAADLVERTLCKDFTGAQDYCGPGAFPPEPDRLFRNRGDGTFEDVTQKVGIRGGFGGALGAVGADFNGDGRPDLYVANDSQPNNLWLQQPDGTFVDDALLAGCAVNSEGKAEASMGVDAADFDGDGDLDLFMAHLTGETNTLFLNDGEGVFDDRTIATGLGSPSRFYTSFGTLFFDYDNDGWLDLLVVSGAVKKIEALARQGDPLPLHQPNQLFRNLGNGAFAEVTAQAGPVFELSEVSRGAAFGDIDNDGDTDVLLSNNSGPARLLINEIGNRSHWLGVRLAGDNGHDMIGSRVALNRRGRPTLHRRVRTDGSFASANDPRVLFGLGDDDGFDRLEVIWPDGTVEAWTDLPIDAYTTLHPGEGAAVPQ